MDAQSTFLIVATAHRQQARVHAGELECMVGSPAAGARRSGIRARIAAMFRTDRPATRDLDFVPQLRCYPYGD